MRRVAINFFEMERIKSKKFKSKKFHAKVLIARHWMIFSLFKNCN